MWRDAAIVLMAAGATIVAFAGGLWLRDLARRRPWVDVLDMIEPPRIPTTGSGVKPPLSRSIRISRDIATDRIEIPVAMPLRCICSSRMGMCDCAIDGVRNPRGAGRALLQDALARQRGENIDGTPRRETRVRLEGRW